MVEYTPRAGIPYPSSDDTVKPQSRDLVSLALAADAGIGDAVATAELEAKKTDDRVTGIAATMSANLAVQREHYEGMLADNGTAYDVYVAQLPSGDPVMTRAQWLDSLKVPGPEGPAGGTAVTDPQVAAMVESETATKAALRDGFVERRGVRGQVRTVYVRATGNDSNDGTSEAAAFREIRAAVDSVSADGPVVRGSVVVDVGPGNYKGGIRLPQTRGAAQDDYLVIRGPAVGAHPNVPTAVIDSALDPSAGWGVLAEDGATLWIENLKFVGAFPNAVRIERGVFMQWRNVHVDGQGVGGNGASIQHQCRYVIVGGIVENLVTTGILELFNCTRSFGGASSNAAQMIIRNCGIGLQAKEGGAGHLDWLNVEDCGTGIELNGLCVANVKAVSLKRNTVGIANVNSEIHNASSVNYGTGADANPREYIALGAAATDLTDIGWAGAEFARTSVSGHRPLLTLGANYADATVTGTTSETTFYQTTGIIQPHRYNVAGKRVKIVAWGSVNTPITTANGFRILLRFGSLYLGDARIPQSATVGDDFRVEFELICDKDGNSQKMLSTIVGYPAVPTGYSVKTIDMTSQNPIGVRLSGIAGAASESVTLRMMEVYG